MSLILEALKKLEREKNVPDRGFVVMAPVSWGSATRSRIRLVALGTVLFVVAAGFAAGYLWVRGASSRGPAPAAAGSNPLPQSTATAAPVTRLADSSTAATSAPTVAAPLPSQQWPTSDRPTNASTTPARSVQATAPPEPRPQARIPTPAPAARPSAEPALPQSTQAARRPTQEPPRPSATPAASGAPREDAATTPQTQPAAPAASATNEPLQLEAISMRDGRPIAVLSGRLVQEGDHFDGVRVLRIGAAEVELEVGGRRRVIRF